MEVKPYDIGTFLVESRSKRDGVESHLVDLAFVEEGHRKPKPACGCWRSYCHGEVCSHIEAVVQFERERLGL